MRVLIRTRLARFHRVHDHIRANTPVLVWPWCVFPSCVSVFEQALTDAHGVTMGTGERLFLGVVSKDGQVRDMLAEPGAIPECPLDCED